MTAITSTYADGQTVDDDIFNIAYKALLSILLKDDNAGKIQLPVGGMGLPFAVRGGQSAAAHSVGPSTTYTVPAGKLFFVRRLSNTTTGAIQIDPTGAGAAWNISAATAVIRSVRCGLCLGAGDALITPASAYAAGILIDVAEIEGSPVRVLQEVDNAVSYTVAASKAVLLTHALPSTALAAVLNRDGVGAVSGDAPGGVAGDTVYDGELGLWLKTTQVLAGASASKWTISGLEYPL